jgi:hypothetical protein
VNCVLAYEVSMSAVGGLEVAGRRQLAGSRRLKGDNREGRYVIADVQMKHDFPTERRAFFEPAGNPGGTVLVHGHQQARQNLVDRHHRARRRAN